jgi:O-antigen ligase
MQLSTIVSKERWAWFLNNPLPWRIAYAAALLIPWMLIFKRGGAEICTVAIDVLFLWHSIKNQSWAWCKDPVLRVCLVAWLWLLLVVTPFAVDRLPSFSVALPWVRYLLLYASLRYWVLVRREALQWLSYMLFFMLSLVALDTLWQYFTGTTLTRHAVAASGRLTGPMDNVKVGIFVTKLLLPPIGITLFFSLAAKQPQRALAIVTFLLLCVILVILSGERTALVSTMLGILIATSILMTGGRKSRIAGLTLIACLGAIFLILFTTQSFVQKRAMVLYDNLHEFRHSSYGQLFYTGTELGKQHWVTGTGLKGFRELCFDLLDAKLVTHCNLHPHNPYIEWFAEAGLVGLLLFITMVGLLIRQCLQALPHYQGIARIIPATALGTLAVHFFPLMVTQSIFSNWPAILLWYSVGMAIAMLNIAPDQSV